MHDVSRSEILSVASLGLGQMAAFASSFYLMGVLGDAIGADLGLTPAAVFGMVSLSLAVPAVIAPRVARWIDARGGRTVLLASHLVFALSLVATAGAQGLASLGAAMLLMGLGMALGLSPTPFAILVARHSVQARGPITAVALIGGLGSAIGWPLTAAFADHWGWRGACLIWAVVQLLVCLPLTLALCPRDVAGRRELRRAPTPVWDRPMMQLAGLFAGAWFVSTCMSAHLPRLLAAYGLPTDRAAAAAGLMGLAALVVRFAEFTVLRRLPPLATTRAAALMHPAGAASLGLLGAPAAGVMAIAQGAGNGMLTVAKGVLPLNFYGADDYAYRSALIGRPAMIAQIAGPLVYAQALERSPALALSISAGVCVAMFLLTFGLSPRRSCAVAAV